MEFWQRVHWFATSRCNQKCRFCFKPDFAYKDSKETTRALAEMLIQNNVRGIIFTGGEPLLLKSLYSTLEILSSNGIDTSVHTNSILLAEPQLDRLAELVDEIALPIDSLNPKTQEYLRSKEHLKYFKKAFNALQDKPLRIGIHTVATQRNISHIPRIYQFLDRNRFDYWRIYQYNADLVLDRFSNIKRFNELQALDGRPATAENGGVYHPLADFLLAKEKISGFKDKRIEFVGVKDYDRSSYFFVDSSGDASYCNYFLQGKRKFLGNLFKEGFKRVKDRAIRAEAQGPLFDEEAFSESFNDMPLWARAAWEGNYLPEEIEDLQPRYYERFSNLSKLYFDRLKQQGKIPKRARLAI
jgi:MoaA/NifB/PqqE/SkfB family radical SAM enzyme